MLAEIAQATLDEIVLGAECEAVSGSGSNEPEVRILCSHVAQAESQNVFE